MPFCNLRLTAPRTPDFPIPYARNPKTIGEHIRKARLFRGLRQRDVAETLGVRTETVANWERGRERPLARHHGAIIRFLGFDPAPPARSLSERLRGVRLRLGLTQEAMGQKLGLDEWSVCAWESGRRQPSRWMAVRLVSLLDAIDGTDSNPGRPTLSFYDLTRWRRRSPTEQVAGMPATIGEQIRQARLRARMSQVQAARVLGVHRTTVQTWEAGRKAIGRQRMRMVLKFIA